MWPNLCIIKFRFKGFPDPLYILVYYPLNLKDNVTVLLNATAPED